MCRFVAYSGPSITLSSLLIEPTNSLIHQSFHSYETEEPVNGDGFGIAWYVPRLSERPGLFRSSSPAWSNRNLLSVTGVTESECILAHVRAASKNLVVSEANCHPFVWNRFAFMHNGDVGGFRRIRRDILQSLSDRAFDTIQGGTDSEHVFAMLLDELAFDVHPRLDVLVEAVRRTIRKVAEIVQARTEAEPAYLNLAVTDGHNVVVSRYVSHGRSDAASLHYSAGNRYECHDGICQMSASTPGEHAVIVSSEPLSADGRWQTVPTNHLVVVDPGRSVQVTPI